MAWEQSCCGLNPELPDCLYAEMGFFHWFMCWQVVRSLLSWVQTGSLETQSVDRLMLEEGGVKACNPALV